MLQISLGSLSPRRRSLVSNCNEARLRSLHINDLAFALGSKRMAQAARDEVTHAFWPTGRTPLPLVPAAP